MRKLIALFVLPLALTASCGGGGADPSESIGSGYAALAGSDWESAKSDV